MTNIFLLAYLVTILIGYLFFGATSYTVLLGVILGYGITVYLIDGAHYGYAGVLYILIVLILVLFSESFGSFVTSLRSKNGKEFFKESVLCPTRTLVIVAVVCSIVTTGIYTLHAINVFGATLNPIDLAVANTYARYNESTRYDYFLPINILNSIILIIIGLVGYQIRYDSNKIKFIFFVLILCLIIQSGISGTRGAVFISIIVFFATYLMSYQKSGEKVPFKHILYSAFLIIIAIVLSAFLRMFRNDGNIYQIGEYIFDETTILWQPVYSFCFFFEDYWGQTFPDHAFGDYSFAGLVSITSGRGVMRVDNILYDNNNALLFLYDLVNDFGPFLSCLLLSSMIILARLIRSHLSAPLYSLVLMSCLSLNCIFLHGLFRFFLFQNVSVLVVFTISLIIAFKSRSAVLFK